jgi:protein SCO1/2
MWVVRTVLLGGLACSVYACAATTPAARHYELEGQILAIRPEAREVLIKHGDIKGFMPGMTMPFKVRHSQLLDGKQAGDLVKATLVVEDTEAWLDTLDRTGSAPLADAAALPAASFVTPVRPGDAAPDAALTNQNGDTITIPSLLRGSHDARAPGPLAVTFIYIRCPLPQFCPMLDRRFAEVQRAIVADPDLATSARVLSVSFDPDADTPPRLTAHAVRLKADPAIWQFATAPRETVDRFAAQFGVNVIREQDGTITHNMRTTVIGADGRVISVYDGGDWTAQQIVDDMRRSLTR